MYERLRRAARMNGLGGDCKLFGAIYAGLEPSDIWQSLSARRLHGGLKDTSSRPPKDLGGALRCTSKTTLWSYEIRANGNWKCPHRQGCVANMTNIYYVMIYERTGEFSSAPIGLYKRS